MRQSGTPTPEELEWAKETVAIGLSGVGPRGDYASDAFDIEFDQALEMLYPLDNETGAA